MNNGTRSPVDGVETDLKSEHKTACASRTRAWKAGELVRATRPIDIVRWEPDGPVTIGLIAGDAMIITGAREIDALGISVYEIEFLYGGVKCDYSVTMDHNFDVGYDFPFERV